MNSSITDPAFILELCTKSPEVTPLPTLVPTASWLENFIAQKQDALSRAPDGQLNTHKPKKGSFSPEYYHILGKKRTYITKSQGELAQALAQKEYDQKQLQEAERLAKLLGRFTSETLTFHDNFGALRPERRELVEPDFLPDETVRELWQGIKYESLGFSPNYPEYYTADNLRVRSIAERKIGTRLFERDILFLYEFPFHMKDGGIVYPDFTCLNLRTRELYLWEHLGRLDEVKYLQNNIRKLERYRASGYHLGINLVTSIDTSANPLTTDEIDRIIDNYLV